MQASALFQKFKWRNPMVKSHAAKHIYLPRPKFLNGEGADVLPESLGQRNAAP
jgi:hypothetical protein